MANKLTLTTPKGFAVYPRLDRPDTKYNDNGQYKCDLSMSPEAAKPLIDKIHKLYKEWTTKNHPKNPGRDNRNALYYMAVDDNDDLTGDVVFKLRVTNKITKKGDLWDRQPAQFDAKGQPITKAKAVSSGSELKVSFEVYQYQLQDGKKGMSLQPEAVQIINLVEWAGTKSASAFGFGEEAGYTAEDDTQDWDKADLADSGFPDETYGDYDSVPADEDDY